MHHKTNLWPTTEKAQSPLFLRHALGTCSKPESGVIFCGIKHVLSMNYCTTTVRCYMLLTWERRCRVEGLRGGGFFEFSSFLFGTRCLKGSCKSKRTRASPTHSAKNLLKPKYNIITKIDRLYLIDYIYPNYIRNNTYGRSGLTILQEIHILSISYEERKSTLKLWKINWLLSKYMSLNIMSYCTLAYLGWTYCSILGLLLRVVKVSIFVLKIFRSKFSHVYVCMCHASEEKEFSKSSRYLDYMFSAAQIIKNNECRS